jgi:hypothetical protein
LEPIIYLTDANASIKASTMVQGQIGGEPGEIETLVKAASRYRGI